MHRDNAGDFWCIEENIAVNDMADHRGGPESNWGGWPKELAPHYQLYRWQREPRR